MSADEARRRVEYQAVGGALMQLDARNPQAAQLIAGLAKAIIVEAERSTRFAKALTDVVDSLASVDAVPDTTLLGVAPQRTAAPRKRTAAPSKKTSRQPGAFDPFVVFRESGSEGLTERLASLDLEQLRDIIADQELDTRKETGRKRKPEVLVTWIVERVHASENKGRVFR
ncbi:hypothetical protein [Gordonia rhizosphera]|uniref:Uncharacterized protein n=1 Tax=Gordonia rhizosphera NBRC 16068 TaxID=1108045 RepID=K6VA77_9ACTN|nr:hypothetical protein [Gordonia rhizosphera]GAB93118.1 hypothetical protein GORHZ_206_00220 [Gordonia rhizosphera NBRC 16068]